jgi:Uma2 family endonuclease
MQMALTQKLMTAEELLRLPDDGQRHELVAGELRTMPSSGEEHRTVAATLTADLGHYVRAYGLGRVLAAGTGFLLTIAPDTVRAPDVAFISRGRATALPVPDYWPGPPDLAVEVVAPSDLYSEVEEKVATWLEHGTQMVIVVNPCGRMVMVHRSPTQACWLTMNDVLDGEDVVPGWTMPVRDLFPTSG